MVYNYNYLNNILICVYIYLERLGVHVVEAEEIIEVPCVIDIVQVLREIYHLQLKG